MTDPVMRLLFYFLRYGILFGADCMRIYSSVLQESSAQAIMAALWRNLWTMWIKHHI